MAMTPIEDETSAFYGKEISLFINISSYTAEKMEFTYEFGSEDGIYYVGQYGVEIEQPEEVVGTKTYTANLTVDHDATLQNEVLYKDKDVVFTKYSTGDVTVTFKAFPVSENGEPLPMCRQIRAVRQACKFRSLPSRSVPSRQSLPSCRHPVSGYCPL